MKTLLVSVVPCLLVTLGLYAYTKNLQTPTVPNKQTASLDKPKPVIPIPQNNALIAANQVNAVCDEELNSNIASTGVEPASHAGGEQPVVHSKPNRTEPQALPKKTNSSESVSWGAVPVEP